MATNTVGIDKEVEVDRKENLRDHRLYWIGRRTQDVILSSLALVVLSPVMLATAMYSIEIECREPLPQMLCQP